MEVTAEATLLQTDTSTLRTLVTEKAVQDLPISGRNFVNLVSMVPGATPTNGAPGGNNNDRRQTSAVSINGGDGTGNNHLIDGMDNNERYIGTIGVKPSMDAIQEIRVETNLYPAESGRTGGGVINILTKSGTNAFHGSAYEFYRNDRFDERDYFATIDPILNQHQFGGSIGGPIVSNRTFFFADYERLNSTSGQVNNLTIPTLKMRQGDFSEFSGQIFDPFTSPRVAFPNNQIPANRIDPIAARYWRFSRPPPPAGWPTTTRARPREFTAPIRRTSASTTGSTRATRSGAAGRQRSRQLQPSRLPGGSGHRDQPGCTVGTNNAVGPHRTTAAGYQANYVRVFSPTLVGEFKGGVMNLALESFAANVDQPNLSAAFGLPGVNVDDIATGLALMNMTGFAVLGDSQNLPKSIKNSTSRSTA